MIEARDHLLHFAGPTQRDQVELLYTDNALELIAAAKSLGWCHDHSEPEDPTSNAIGERNVRHMKEGLTTRMENGGAWPWFWEFAGAHFAHSCNIDTTKELTPWEDRHKKGPFQGPQIPFFAGVDYLPPKSYQRLLPMADTKAVPGVFLGYKLHSGCTWNN